MDIKTKLNKFGLDTKNTIVIGSGILNTLNLRENKDIDIIVTKKNTKNFLTTNILRKFKVMDERYLLTIYLKLE